MGSIPRKPVGGVTTDETRSRNRLSKPKPMSSSRATTERLWSGTEPECTSTSQLSLLQESVKSLSKDESRTQARTHLFETDDDTNAKPQSTNTSKRGGVASLVMQFESTASTSQLSVASSVVPQKPLHGIYGSKRSSGSLQQQVYTVNSRDSLTSYRGSTNNLQSPSASLDQLSSQYSVPRRRQSSYRPGEATRKPSMQDKENEPPTAHNETTNDEAVQDTAVGKGEAGQNPGLRNSSLYAGRTDTPTGLDVKAIGGLRLGSLHVVNGRSSPILSELSRQLISRQLRDVSSEYAESETGKESVGEMWEDDEVMDETESNGPSTPTRTTYVADTKGVIPPERDACTPKPDASSPPCTPTQTSDKTSMLAQAYMSELQGSPFSLDEPSPSSTGSVIHHEQDEQEESPMSLEQSSTFTSVERNFSFESKQGSVDSGVSSMHTDRTRDDVFSSALEYQAPDLQPPPSPERQASPEHLRPESVSRVSDKADSGYHSGASMLSLNVIDPKHRSLHTPVQTVFSFSNSAGATKEEGSKEASPKPKKAASPKKLGGFLPLRPTFKRAPATEPVMAQTERVQPESPVTKSTAKLVTKADSSPAKAKKIKEEKKEKEKEEKKEKEREEKRAKAQKKLQKSRPLSKARQPKEIVVQRLPSWESASNIPPVPDTVKDNLKRRSLLVPELERTFRTQDHIRDDPGTSTLALPLNNIRFPSPRPSVEEEDSRSRSAKKGQERPRDRPRSKSRRRSFLDYFRSDRDSGRQGADATKEETRLSIADFGDVMMSLGSNPYDIAHSRSHSQNPSSGKPPRIPSTNPHDITVNRQRPRSSMNDEQASEFARRRSHSFSGRNDIAERRLSFDDRGGLPGKILRTSLVLDDAPPMPPLPTQEELRRISMRQSLHSSTPNTPSRAQHFWGEDMYSGSVHEPEPESSPAPMPPAHSPRPSFIDQQYEDQYEVEDDIELAPPPPSHSPAPLDVAGPPPPSHSPRPLSIKPGDSHQNIWEAQAQAWKARRQSAGEALRNHRRPLDPDSFEHDSSDERVIDESGESDYPAIPPRHPGRKDWDHRVQPNSDQSMDHQDAFYQANQTHRSQTWNEGSYDQYHDEYPDTHPAQSFEAPPLRRNQTWDDSQEYLSANGSTYFYKQRHQGSRQSGHMSRGSNDSRQSFYSHHNCQIDRPFDPPPQLLEDFDDDYDYPNEYYTPRSSPVRGQGLQQLSYGYDGRYGVDGHYHDYQQNSQHGFHFYGRNDHQQMSQSPERLFHRQHQSPQGYQSQSPRLSPVRSHRNSLAPPSPSPSRPESRQSRHSLVSMRSNGSAISLAEELHPEINHRPSPAPEFGRYSGGLGYGYEGRETGFGGSAGTRTVSGKADAMWKGTELRGDFGVDLGDVPVIGVVKKLPG